MKRFFLFLVAVGMLSSCAKVAFTGRTQLKLIPESQINEASYLQYAEYLKENSPMRSGSEVETIRRIGKDIQLATEVFFEAQGMSAALENFAWEFNVVNSPEVNAFCMPGGKVVVYTGIMKVAQNEDALAAVMGHEIAHALAHHGNERMSQAMGMQVAMTGLDAYMQIKQGQATTQAEAEKAALTRQMLMAAVGLGAQVGILLPFSRKHESEADEIGLYLMTMAGYNPGAAAPFWERMAASSQGQRPPQFLSTHPDPAQRSEALKALASRAYEYKAKYPVPGTSRNR